MSGWRERFRSKPFAFWMTGGGLAYLGLGLIVAGVVLGGLTLGFLLFIVAIGVLFLLSAYGVLGGRRWGLAAGIVVTILTLVLFSFTVALAYSNPASPAAGYVVTALPISFLVIAFSILCLRKWKTGVQNVRYLASHESAGGLVAMLVVGLALGSLIVGVAVSPLITNILDTGGQPVDIRIVPNAPNAAEPYTPRNFTVVLANATVTWYNGDTNDHTVTSDTGVFDSPLLHSGDRFTFRFTQRGTYPYHCAPHPNMVGSVTVT